MSLNKSPDETEEHVSEVVEADSQEDVSEPEDKGKTRGVTENNKKGAKRTKPSSSDEDVESDDEDEVNHKHKKIRRKKGSDDEDWKAPKKPATKKVSGESSGGGMKRETGLLKQMQLSADLAAVVGEKAVPRQQVVKRVWAYIKENNLYDSKNRQFAICDEKLHKVTGVNRFRIFGMMKYLKNHMH